MNYCQSDRDQEIYDWLNDEEQDKEDAQDILNLIKLASKNNIKY
jgi:hypothetical protein